MRHSTIVHAAIAVVQSLNICCVVKHSESPVQGPGKRILTFVVGGITRSELRVAHALAARTGRDITLGSTSIETPASFLQRVQVRCRPCQQHGRRC